MLVVRKTDLQAGVSLEQVNRPSCAGADEVLVAVAAVGICGSDIHVYEWSESYDFMKSKLPVTLGHEFSGRITEVGFNVKNLAVGDLVAVLPTSSCMKCSYCAGGQPNLCTDRQTIGLTRDGAFASLVRAPAISCLKLDPQTDPVLAALIEPLAVGDHAANVGEIKAGDTVVVLGPGTIGQAIVYAAKCRGALNVIVVGMNDETRLKTTTAMGATHTIDLAQTSDLLAAVLSINDNVLADVVIEATGHPSSLSAGLTVLRRGGVFVAAGIHSVPVSFDLTRLVRNSQQIRGAHGSRRRSWEIIAQRILLEPEAFKPMVSLELALSDAELGFTKCLAREVSKVILRPDEVIENDL
jgi:threonine dehydrogenase-like Zn-dependent dehydrogenase